MAQIALSREFGHTHLNEHQDYDEKLYLIMFLTLFVVYSHVVEFTIDDGLVLNEP